MQIKHLKDIDYTKLMRTVDLIIPAQNAKLSPPVGPILGQVKIKVKDFCTQFNEATSVLKPGLPLRIIVFVYKNETFNFLIRTPSLSFLIKNCVALNKKPVLTLLDIYKIMLIKRNELDHLSDIVIFRNILEMLKNMKIKLVF